MNFDLLHILKSQFEFERTQRHLTIGFIYWSHDVGLWFGGKTGISRWAWSGWHPFAILTFANCLLLSCPDWGKEEGKRKAGKTCKPQVKVCSVSAKPFVNLKTLGKGVCFKDQMTTKGPPQSQLLIFNLIIIWCFKKSKSLPLCHHF